MATDYDAVLTAVSTWPFDQRLALLRHLVDTLDRSLPSTGRPRANFAELRGVARGAGPAPTDDDIRRWIDDYRTEKYG